MILSALFEDLEIDATIVVGTLLVLAGNLFVLDKRVPGEPRSVAGAMPLPARSSSLE